MHCRGVAVKYAIQPWFAYVGGFAYAGRQASKSKPGIVLRYLRPLELELKSLWLSFLWAPPPAWKSSTPSKHQIINMTSAIESPPIIWETGQLVQVKARTWPGINQPGGVGRITGSNSQGTKVAVRYVLDGRREKEIDTKYVTLYNDDNTRLRDRSVMLGRCRRCGSLRSDCGSCDIRHREHEQKRLWQQAQENGGVSSSDEDSIEEVLGNIRRLESQSRKFKRLWRRSRQFLDDSSGEEQANSTEKVERTPKRTRQGETTPESTDMADSNPFSPRELPASPHVGFPDLSSTADPDRMEESDSSSSDDSLILRALAQRHRRRRMNNQEIDLSSSSDEQNVDDDSGIFIQPEGSADALPSDMEDKSSRIPYAELPEFCDRIVHRLEREELPASRLKYLQFERESTSPSVQLANRISETYQDWITKLVRQGTDQCQAALRRIARQYRRQKDSLPAERRQDFRGTGMEIRETRVDNLSRTVEELMSRLWQLKRTVQGQDGESEDEVEENKDDGWADPAPLDSPVLQSPQLFTRAEPVQVLDSNLDPHAHASSTMRRAPATRMGRFIQHRNERNHRRRQKVRKKSEMRGYSTGKSGKPNHSRHSEEQQPTFGDENTGQRPSKRHRRVEKTRSNTESLFQGSLRSQSIEIEFGTPCPGTKSLRQSSERSSDGVILQDSMLKGFFSEPKNRHSREDNVQTSAVDRMEKFLRANKMNVDDNIASEDDDSHSQPTDVQCQRHSVLKKGDTEENSIDFFENEPHTTARNGNSDSDKGNGSPVSHRWFNEIRSFARAHGSQRPESRKIGDSIGTENGGFDIESECTTLELEYKSHRGREALANLASVCLSNAFSENPKALRIFTSLWKCLQKYGTRTLQYFVARRSGLKDLSQFVKLHVAILHAAASLNEGQRSDVSETTRPVMLADYVEFLVLQLTDSMLSALLPEAWGLRITKTMQVLKHLDPLRSALGRHCNLLESFARCLVKKLPSQQWYLTPEKTSAYISCIDPVWWSEFLCHGSNPKEPDTSTLRYRELTVSLPRSEIDAVWALLGYGGLERMEIQEAAPCTRKLISFLFSSGSLHCDAKHSTLPPSSVQTGTCAAELRNVSSLLWAKSVDGLTIKDSFLTNLIKHSVTIAAENVAGVEKARIALFPAFERSSGDWPKLKRFRKQFCRGVDHKITLRFDATVISDIVSTSHTFLGQEEYLPSAGMLKNGLELFLAWQSILPCKRVRYTNFEKVKNSLVSYFEMNGNISHTEESMGAFHEAFSTHTPTQSGHGGRRKSTFYLEAAAYFEMIYATSLGLSTNLPAGVGPVSAHVLVKKIWNIFSGPTRTDQIVDSFPDLPTLSGAPNSQDPYFLCVCARAISFAGLLCEGCLPSVSDGEDLSTLSRPLLDVEDVGTLRNFVFECLATCLDAAVCLASSVECTCFVLRRILVYIDQVSKIHANKQGDLTEDLFVSATRQRLDKACCKCIAGIVASSSCGSEEDICLSLGLLVTDFVSLSQRADLPETQQQDDIWGGLDDSLFVALDIDHKSNKDLERNLDLLLAYALLEAIPSARFVKQQKSQDCTSIQGRMIIVRRLKWICRSLLLRWTISGNEDVKQVLSAFHDISLMVVVSEKDVDDLVYSREVSFSLLVTMCELWEARQISSSDIIFERNALTLKTLEYLLDSSDVAGIPSQDFAASALESGSAANEMSLKELVLYKSFRRGGLKSARRKCGKAWFVRGVVARIQDMEEKTTSLLSAFVQSAAEFPSGDSSSTSFSMEQELCRRLHSVFCFLHRLENVDSFEVVSCAVLGMLSTESLRLHVKIASSSEPERSSTKYLHLLNAYLQMYGSVLAYILSQDRLRNIVSVKLRDHVLNECLVPILSRRRKLADTMARNIAFANRTTNSTTSSSMSSTWFSEMPGNANDAFMDFLRRLLSHFIRWIFFQTKNRDSRAADGLLDSLFLSVDSRQAASTLVGEMFGTIVGADDNSGLAGDMNDLLRSFIPDDVEVISVGKDAANWVTHVLEELARRLGRPYLKPDERVWRLIILEHVLQHCQTGKFHNLRIHLKPFTLALMASLVATSLRYTLSANEVNNEAVEASLICLAALYALPSHIMGGNDCGWITDWCADYGSHEAESPSAILRQYFSMIKKLFAAVCEAILESGSEHGVLNDYRRKLIESGGWGPLSNMNENSIQQLKKLEQDLGLSSNTIGSTQIKNVYATRKQTMGPALFVPDRKILAAAERFLVEIKRD